MNLIGDLVEVLGYQIGGIIKKRRQKKDFDGKLNCTIKTLRGELVQSEGERRIADFLFEKEIQYDYDTRRTFEGTTPYKYGYTSRWTRPDFYLKNHKIVIEYWGMTTKPQYAKKRSEKERLYFESKTKYISIDPNDLNNLEEILTVKLKGLGVNYG